ncbi:unnamed protein product [Owenia fusiformis]|uniref:Sorting nexin-17 n=1 Tax=Owenia fusiformis TaxID=6347 RepID=A0A8J1XQJ7_OWEFU|nr:unnamed protein product [Owenia fusiformis]
MHFSIPDTTDFKDEGGSSYTSFNVHINGVFHCSVRYKQLHNFHEQLKKEFTTNALPPFPPKKLLSLSGVQLEERRMMLERYVQIISQEPRIANSHIFNGFLLQAQQETQQEAPENVTLEVFLMNGHKISIDIQSTDQTDDVIESVASNINLPEDFAFYFGLYLVKKEEGADLSIVRKLQDFESPHISLKAANKEGVHKIVLRKGYWDISMDDDLLEDRVAMNLLYVQAVSDVERNWVMVTKDQHKQLQTLKQKSSKKEYLKLVKTLKFYGYIQFKPAITDYPRSGCRAIVSAGNKELNFRIQDGDEVKEGTFKVTRMRCWRITTSTVDDNDRLEGLPRLELAFEYLIARDELKWITILSDQAILISMCLQGMVDELIMKKQGKRVKRPAERARNRRTDFIKRDSAKPSLLSSPVLNELGDNASEAVDKAKESVKRISDKLAAAGIKSPLKGNNIGENDAFEGIGDDDL